MKTQYPFGYKEQKSDSVWSEEQECVPLKQRLKMLRAKEMLVSAVSPVDDAVNKKDEFRHDQDRGVGRSGSASCEQKQNGRTSGRSPFQDDPVTHLPNCLQSSSSDDIGNSECFDENLDHVPLKERRSMLLSRELVRPIRPAMEFNSPDPSTNPDGIKLQTSGLGSNSCRKRSAIGKSIACKKDYANVYASSEALKPGSLNGITSGAPAWTHQHVGTTVKKSQNIKNVYKEARPCSSGRSDVNKKGMLSSSCKDINTSASKPFPNVKVEPLDGDFEIPNKSICNPIFVKGEAVNSSESLEDIVDHMMLGDRMRLLASRKFPKSLEYENYETYNDLKLSKSSRSSKPILIKPRKRRRTVTDSVETALEEDAPGLLKVLIEKGVLVDEIKLYGANEDVEALDESSLDESFSDLEDVITKIFSQQPSLFKFAPVRCGKGEKTSYCLACLISLVEQARYLRVKKWPVEWGWCRDLQSFIFVFNKHNRIVLERPEYGYATYFFELVDALPVNWQIKRLVTTMKLTSITRMTLIENRALRVGDELTEGEARVLIEYGWIPDSGLGTMLNYCDRVVHDRRNDSESDSSEWRSKIGKLLTDGYNGGCIVLHDIPKKVMEYGLGNTPEIKLEY